ncbi:MAG: hypothetical protein ACRDIB_09645, partial [Ardenticatenaceae bacterium]
MKHWLALLGILLLLAATRFAPIAGADIDNDNATDGYLFNGGFEGNFNPVGAGQVAEGWTRTHLDGNPNWMSTQIFANGGWVEKIGGQNSHILSVEALGIGQPFKTVLHHTANGLTPGQTYSLSGWVLKMWGGSANTQTPGPYDFGSRIGIDPTGGGDPTAPSVIWGEYDWQQEARGRFVNHWLAARAQGSSMTVFVELWLKWQKAETQAIVDAFELYDAPAATLATSPGFLTTPSLEWTGALPTMLDQLGNYAMFYEVQQWQSDLQAWAPIATELRTKSAPIPLTEGESGQFRVLPY